MKSLVSEELSGKKNQLHALQVWEIRQLYISSGVLMDLVPVEWLREKINVT